MPDKEETLKEDDLEIKEQVEGEPGEGEGCEGEGADLEKLLALKEEELKNAHDKLLRLVADLDNTRKRLEREKSESISYANEGIMRELLPVIDNLERAIEHGEKEGGCESILEGVRMTLKGFLEALNKHGGSSFESVGQPFDPNRHEAVTQEVTSEFPDMTVTREFQKGYMLRDRLLRPSMVGVARNSKTD
ncbi:MAG: nucleotide exchange factor GrpE [Syntrophobacteraceae bacterium]